MRYKLKFLSALTLFCCFVGGCQAPIPPEPISMSAFKLNTVITITVYDSSDQSLLTQCMELLDHYEMIFSRTLEGSEIYRLNHRNAPEAAEPFPLSPPMSDLLEKGLYYGKLSEGAMDISIAPLSDLWDFTSGNGRVPDAALIREAQKRVDYRRISADGQSVTFLSEGMAIDAGAIAKGYIADRLRDYLFSQGVRSALINLGGNLVCIGGKPDGSPFTVGIQKPFADRSETVATMDITDLSVVSSGIYERFFEQDGKIYHHILNPKTGYPCDNGLVSVTIISKDSIDGDGLSTSCFALGLEKGMALVESQKDVYGIFITEDGQIHYSFGTLEAIPVTETGK